MFFTVDLFVDALILLLHSNDSDVRDFEREMGIKAFFVMPPLNDRKRQEEILQLLAKLGIISYAPRKNSN